MLAGKYNLGHVTVCVQSSMVQLRCLLQKETSPLKLICNAMGVSGASCSDVEELDSALAQRLTVSQFPSGLLGVMHSDDQATAGELMLLHFFTLCYKFMCECKTHIIYTCVCGCVCVCVCVCSDVWMCIHVHMCSHISVCACVHFMCNVRAFSCTYMCVCICVCVHICLPMCSCICVLTERLYIPHSPCSHVKHSPCKTVVAFVNI